jgi:hypothetical protein
MGLVGASFSFCGTSLQLVVSQLGRAYLNRLFPDPLALLRRFRKRHSNDFCRWSKPRERFGHLVGG